MFKQYDINRFGSKINIIEYNINYASQVVKSPTGYRQAMENFTHPWYTSRGYKVKAMVNLSYFNMDAAGKSIFNGALIRDSGAPEGIPGNGHVMWLDNTGKMHVKLLNTVGIKGIPAGAVCGSSLAYSLILDGKISLQHTNGFNVYDKTGVGGTDPERTFIGQKADLTIVLACAKSLNGMECAQVLLELGCIVGVMGDGGGSTEMIVDGKEVFPSTRKKGTVWMVLEKITKPAAVLPVTLPQKPPVIIDTAHGGKDPGGGSSIFWDPKGFYEKYMSLDISMYQYNRLIELEYPVFITRKSDFYLSPEERTDIIKKSGAVYCWSNHVNAAANTDARGVETIHSIYSDSKLATALLQSVVDAGMPKRRVFFRKGADDRDYYFMHRETGKVETTIIEYGFATNVVDAKLLQENWRIYAEAVLRAFCKFVQHPYSTPSITNLYRVIVDDRQIGAYVQPLAIVAAELESKPKTILLQRV